MPSSTPGTLTSRSPSTDLSSHPSSGRPNMATRTREGVAMPDIGLFEAIYSARSIRRLKPDPVPEEGITEVLDAALRAPSGGNAQSWAFVVGRDPDQRQKLGAIYRKASDIAEAVYAARGRPAHLTEGQFARMMTAGAHLWAHM